MADNVVLPGTGVPVASDDIGGNQFQRVKLVHGADGVNDGDVSTANPYPITLTQGEVVEALEAMRMAVHSLTRTVGQSMPDVAGRLRVNVEAIATIAAITTLTTLTTLTNQTQIGGNPAFEQIPALMRIGADSLRRNVSVT
jgi:hypothetical protein